MRPSAVWTSLGGFQAAERAYVILRCAHSELDLDGAASNLPGALSNGVCGINFRAAAAADQRAKEKAPLLMLRD